MILVDTSVWVDYLRSGDAVLAEQLARLNVLAHPFVVAELALGLLQQRSTILAYLDHLPTARIAHLPEVRMLVEMHSLHGRGIGLIDAHLLASTFINQPCRLWTRDKRLKAVAQSLGLHIDLP